jgi:hypothetical protein
MDENISPSCPQKFNYQGPEKSRARAQEPRLFYFLSDKI